MTIVVSFAVCGCGRKSQPQSGVWPFYNHEMSFRTAKTFGPFMPAGVFTFCSFPRSKFHKNQEITEKRNTKEEKENKHKEQREKQEKKKTKTKEKKRGKTRKKKEKRQKKKKKEKRKNVLLKTRTSRHKSKSSGPRFCILQNIHSNIHRFYKRIHCVVFLF